MTNFKTYGSPEKDAFMLALLTHKGLSGTIVICAGAIVDAYDGEPVPISIEDFKALANVTHPSVLTALNKLIRWGFIHRTRPVIAKGAKSHYEPILPDLGQSDDRAA